MENSHFCSDKILGNNLKRTVINRFVANETPVIIQDGKIFLPVHPKNPPFPVQNALFVYKTLLLPDLFVFVSISDYIEANGLTFLEHSCS
jgi:hypothetical protein